MTKIIEGVPDRIARADYNRLIESVGFDLNFLLSLRFERDGVYAETFDTDAKGNPRIEDDELVRNVVYIPVKDTVEPPACGHWAAGESGDVVLTPELGCGQCAQTMAGGDR